MSSNTSGINNSEGFIQDVFTPDRPPQYNSTTLASSTATPGLAIPGVGQPLTAEALAGHNLANEPAEGSSRGWICAGSRLMTADLKRLDEHYNLETSRLPRTGTMARTGCASSRATTAALGNQMDQAEHTGDIEVSGAGLRFDEPAGLRPPKIPDEDVYDILHNA